MPFLSLNLGHFSERHFKCIVFILPIRFLLIHVLSHSSMGRGGDSKLPKQVTSVPHTLGEKRDLLFNLHSKTLASHLGK